MNTGSPFCRHNGLPFIRRTEARIRACARFCLASLPQGKRDILVLAAEIGVASGVTVIVERFIVVEGVLVEESRERITLRC